MKKQLTAVMLMLTLLLTMNGCFPANAAQQMEAAEDRIEVKLDGVEDRLEERFREIAPTAPVETQPAAAGTPQLLTREQAGEIALEYVGLTADQITRLHVEYEVDDGIPQFDVEFHQGDWEYEFEIHAENGNILSYDKDHAHD